MEIDDSRNSKIYQEYIDGATYEALGKKYLVSAARIGAIVKNEKRKAEHNANHIYGLISSLCDDKKVVTRTYTLLERLGATTEEEILKLDRNTLKKARNCGEKIECIIMKLKEIIEKDRV